MAVNKLSLNVRKIKFVVFHAINKDIEELVPELQINSIAIERVKLGKTLKDNDGL